MRHDNPKEMDQPGNGGASKKGRNNGGGLDAVRHISAKLLKNDPVGAGDELVTVLQEVSKTFLGFESVLVRYLSLRFIPATRDKDQDELIKLEGPQVRQMVGEFRAHCKRIGILYRFGLQAWFETAPISREEKLALDRLFAEFEDSDTSVIVPAVDELATWLETEVAATSELVNNGRFDDYADLPATDQPAASNSRREVGITSRSA